MFICCTKRSSVINLIYSRQQCFSYKMPKEKNSQMRNFAQSGHTAFIQRFGSFFKLNSSQKMSIILCSNNCRIPDPGQHALPIKARAFENIFWASINFAWQALGYLCLLWPIFKKIQLLFTNGTNNLECLSQAAFPVQSNVCK